MRRRKRRVEKKVGESGGVGGEEREAGSAVAARDLFLGMCFFGFGSFCKSRCFFLIKK